MRCNGAPEDLAHRMIHCPRNNTFKQTLFDKLNRQIDLSTLPASFWRVAAVPINFSQMNASDTCHVLDYLWSVTVDGACALARIYRGLPVQDC